MKGEKGKAIKEYDMLLAICDKHARTETDPELAAIYDAMANACGQAIKELEGRV